MEKITLTDEHGNKFEADVSALRKVRDTSRELWLGSGLVMQMQGSDKGVLSNQLKIGMPDCEIARDLYTEYGFTSFRSNKGLGEGLGRRQALHILGFIAHHFGVTHDEFCDAKEEEANH